jgi:hypothetical protein
MMKMTTETPSKVQQSGIGMELIGALRLPGATNPGAPSGLVEGAVIGG